MSFLALTEFWEESSSEFLSAFFFFVCVCQCELTECLAELTEFATERSEFSLGDLRISSTSTERQKRSQNLAPALVIISWNSLVFSRKLLPVLVFTGAVALARQHQ